VWRSICDTMDHGHFPLYFTVYSTSTSIQTTRFPTNDRPNAGLDHLYLLISPPRPRPFLPRA